MSARPGLTVDQYRSLLINTAAGVESKGWPRGWSAALNSTVTAYPTSLSLGAGGRDPLLNRALTLTNIGSAPGHLLALADHHS